MGAGREVGPLALPQNQERDRKVQGAKFISKYLNYSLGVQDEVAEVFARGKRVIVKHIEAQFGPGSLTETDIHYALDVLPLHGLPEDRDTGSDISGRSRLGLFDSSVAAKTHKWTDDEHELVLKTLRESPQYGIDFIEIVPQLAPMPWPSYDSVEDLDTILAIIDATQIPVEKVIAFEKENRNRPDVIEALEDLVEGDTEDEAVFINAGS